ncbi:hypothetical protein DL95DRAFT_4641 [Leptodontidium sp. 2 PMI_412]|nr:hypothetical protein DL95DRAFT_4641 [Leptodontidium sp. 2 PMI_412]
MASFMFERIWCKSYSFLFTWPYYMLAFFFMHCLISPSNAFPKSFTSRCIALHRIRNEIPNHKSPLSPPLNLIVLVLAHPGIPYTSTAFGGVIISSGAARCRAILIVIPTPKQAVKKATQKHRRITYVFYIGFMRSFVHFRTILCFRKYLI